MREDIDPVQWAGQQAVVALPEHMDASNAGQIREELLSVINGGATALIADMTATTSCGHAGADAVVCAFQRAVISGTELRLVVTAQHVSQMLSFSGLDRLVCTYPSVEAATGASKPAVALAVVARPGASWQRIRWEHRPEWAIATFVSGSGRRATRAGRCSTWLCRSCAGRWCLPGPLIAHCWSGGWRGATCGRLCRWSRRLAMGRRRCCRSGPSVTASPSPGCRLMKRITTRRSC